MPVIYHKAIDGQTQLAVWEITETAAELLPQLQLRQHELDFIASLSNARRLLHWLSTRLLLRTLLNTRDYIDCRMDEHGKPYLADASYHISLSHSFDYAAVMIGKGRSVGIDVELINTKILRVQQKFLSAAELQPVRDQTFSLYICWCIKEAVYKWYGKKGLELKKHIHIQPFTPAAEGLVSVLVDLPGGSTALNVSYIHITADYMMAYVVA